MIKREFQLLIHKLWLSNLIEALLSSCRLREGFYHRVKHFTMTQAKHFSFSSIYRIFPLSEVFHDDFRIPNTIFRLQPQGLTLTWGKALFLFCQYIEIIFFTNLGSTWQLSWIQPIISTIYGYPYQMCHYHLVINARKVIITRLNTFPCPRQSTFPFRSYITFFLLYEVFQGALGFLTLFSVYRLRSSLYHREKHFSFFRQYIACFSLNLILPDN